jgi:ABC-type enterochelin transport system substrate-binding protein
MSFVSELFRRFSLADFHSASVHTQALTNEWLRDIDGTIKETMKREQKVAMFLFLQEKSVALFGHSSRLSHVSASPDLFFIRTI